MKKIKYLWLISAIFLTSLTACNYVEFNPVIKPGGDTIIANIDTLHYFITRNNDGSWNVLFLFPKELVKTSQDTTYYYVGNVSNWQKILIPRADKSYTINVAGIPEKTTSGKFIGASVNLTAIGLYNIAFVYSTNLWADLTGRTSMLRLDNPGLAWFYFNQGVLTPRGEKNK